MPPRKVKTRRQRKRATAKKNAGKDKHPEEKSGNLDENRLPLVLPSKGEEKKVAIISSDKLVKKKADNKRGRKPKGTRKVGELENDEEQYSSSVSLRPIDENELLDQIWNDLDDIVPTNDENVTKGGLSPNVDWVKQPANQKSNYKLVKQKAAYHRGRTSRETHNACKLENGLDKDKEQNTNSDFDVHFEQILKELNELFPPSGKSVAKGGLSPGVEWEKQSGKQDKAVQCNENLIKKAAHQRETCAVCNLGSAFYKDQEQYSTSYPLSTIDEAELDQILKDLREMFPSSDEAVAKGALSPEVEWDKQSGNLESNLENGPPPSKKGKDETITSTDNFIKIKADYYRKGTTKGTRNACELGKGYPSHFQEQYSSSDLLGTIDKSELDEIWSDLQETYPRSDKTVANVGFYPKMDCCNSGLVGDSGPVPPKFFGNSGYFMLTGTDSQLQQQMKDLAAKNIFVESFVELPDAMADIVDQQMTDLVQNRAPILVKMHDKYDLLAPRRVPRQKKQRKYLKKTDN